MAFNYEDWVYPCTGRVNNLSGYRNWDKRLHGGIDISNDFGTPIYAVCDGIIDSIGGNPTGFGNDFPRVYAADHVLSQTMRDNKQKLLIYYGHCSKTLYPAGTEVKKGQQIALMGGTKGPTVNGVLQPGPQGISTGPHLHFEMRLIYPNGSYSKIICEAFDPVWDKNISNTSSEVKASPGASITALEQWYDHTQGSKPPAAKPPQPQLKEFYIYDISGDFSPTGYYADYKDSLPIGNSGLTGNGYIGTILANATGEIKADLKIIYDGVEYWKVTLKTEDNKSNLSINSGGKLYNQVWVKRTSVKGSETFIP